ncbi:MAG: hypothetical protein ACYSUU_04635, partial [Planctomycetota bacterium]
MFDRRPAFFRFLTAGLVLAVSASSSAIVQDPPAVPDTVEAWRASLWEAAIDGDDAAVESHFARLPADANEAARTELRLALEARDGHDEQSDDDRDAGRREA